MRVFIPKLDCEAFVGMDWGDQEHAFCILPIDGGPAIHGTLKQQSEAIAVWVAELRQRFGGRPVAVCLEQSRGALMFALMQYEFLLICPINPAQLAAYRRALHPSGTKDDPTDAELAARFLRDHSDPMRIWRPDDEISRGLRMLSEQRRDWVEQRVALENQLGPVRNLVSASNDSYPMEPFSTGGLTHGRCVTGPR